MSEFFCRLVCCSFTIKKENTGGQTPDNKDLLIAQQKKREPYYDEQLQGSIRRKRHKENTKGNSIYGTFQSQVS